MKNARSVASIAGIVAIATLISKVFGLVREMAIAAAFGVGPAVNAYAYAYVIPGFLLILLGGINGPFHSALVTVLSRRDKSEAAVIVETVTTLVTGILLLVTVVLMVFGDTFIGFLAPGLAGETRVIAVEQLQIMAPLAILAGLIGIGFGTLNADDQYLLPSISPLFSSLALVGAVALLFLQLGENITSAEYLQLGGRILAWGTLGGAILQWLAQLIAQWRSGMGKLRLRFNWRVSGVGDVLKVMAPATLSSGMLHINVYTDLFFASYIENAAAAMRYGNFIVLTPVGIISNMILVPFLPVFSRLAAPENWPELKVKIRQGLLLTALTMLPLTAIFIALSQPIVQVIYQRYGFDLDAVTVVAPVLRAYGCGMFFYLGRDVLVRVFYALGDGETPFKISSGNIFLNGVLDLVLVQVFATPGLVFATIGVNVVSMGLMLAILNRRLKGLPLKEWATALLGLTFASGIAGFSSWGVSWGLVNWGPLLQLNIGIFVAIAVFSLIALQLKLPEVDMLAQRIKQQFF